jgi:cold shock protein
MTMTKKLTGKVKWFDDARGFGFIKDVPGRLEDIFVHRNGIAGDYQILHYGELVEFELTAGRKGLEADSVRVIARD